MVVVEPPEPLSLIQGISENGEVTIEFNEPMLLEEIFGDFEFTTSAEYLKTSDDDEDSYYERRLR